MSLDTNKISQFIDEPIEYQKQAQTNLEESLKKIVYSKIAGQEAKVDKVHAYKQEINEKSAQLLHYKKTNRIVGRKVANVVIIISMFIIIGLFFIKFLINNKKAIQKYNVIEQDTLKEIAVLNHEKNTKILEVISRVRPYETLKEQLASLGLYLYGSDRFYNLDWTQLRELEHRLVGYKNGIHIKFKSTDSYLVNALFFRYEIVRTTNSITVSKYNFFAKQYEQRTLQAIHEEPTPRVYARGFYIQNTNFEPTLNFTLAKNKTKVKKDAILLNHDFMKTFGIGASKTNLETDTKLTQYFTSLAQERYVTYDRQNAHIPVLHKNGKNLLIEDSSICNLSLTNAASNKPLSAFSDLVASLNEQSEVEHILDQLISQQKPVISNYINHLTFTNLSPVVSREWYEAGKAYKMMAIYDFAQFYDNETTLDDFNLVNKLLNKQLLYFENTCEVIPFGEIVHKDQQFGVQQAMIELTSYHKIDCIDNVYVDGNIVPVPYVKYDPYQIPFFVMYIKKHKRERDYFLYNALEKGFSFLLDEGLNEYMDYFHEPEQTDNQAMVNVLLKELRNQLNYLGISHNDVIALVDDDGYFLIFNPCVIEQIEPHYQWFASWLRKISL
ncbi:hypothetical protein OF376_02095 [Ureaplasma miroungigenitalium]|uniref:Uncharacterized protein n=1 Tax=Ureaplasma miroungigenitalium TaxID=1042321 RepID=A0ABT3BMT0_9BACT|nr:hypothetical protein [Ureaplasma miroungigenitalium]MCV3728555.1 hypothetical protein [Ureaplasma miroungigenitalium]MCV3734438.1 hypothetical protein [Ureaplasma miroungigenitalium]